MPSAISPPSSPTRPRRGITKLTNCRLVRGDELVWDDLWVSSETGRILRSQSTFYDEMTLPDDTIDLGGRIVAPGMIECQLNGAYGFNYSTVLEDMSQYGKEVRRLNRKLVETGVTSYCPTVTSQTSDLYKKVLPFLGPSGSLRLSSDGAESLGAHVEGPFLSPTKNGVHNTAVLREAHSFSDLEDMYGAANVLPGGPIRCLTAAPEQGRMTELIPSLRARGIVFSIGHTEATYEQAGLAVAAGATMITHLFNAMRPLHHRNPGVFGVLGQPETESDLARPFYGVISDGIHLHPTTVKIAYNAHPDGFILVTDAQHTAGLPDGTYRWTNGDEEHFLEKKGAVLKLAGSDTIAGSSATLIECVNNFLHWSGATIPQALKAVTSTPARMLGIEGVKGCLDADADADLVVLSEDVTEKQTNLVVDQVWKFGAKVFEKEGN